MWGYDRMASNYRYTWYLCQFLGFDVRNHSGKLGDGYTGPLSYSWPLNNLGVWGTYPCAVEILYIDFWLPQNLIAVVSWYLWGIGPRIPLNIKILRCSSPLRKMVENNAYSRPSSSADFQLWMKNTVFNLQWVQPPDTNLRIQRSDCIFIEESLHIRVHNAVQIHIVQGSTGLLSLQLPMNFILISK